MTNWLTGFRAWASKANGRFHSDVDFGLTTSLAFQRYVRFHSDVGFGLTTHLVELVDAAHAQV